MTSWHELIENGDRTPEWPYPIRYEQEQTVGPDVLVIGGGPFGGDPRANAKAVKEAGINSAFYVSPDTAHEFLSWRRSLYGIAPLLFRD